MAYFSGAEFSENISFFHTIFLGETDFSGAIFLGNASFFEALFSGEVFFNVAIFSGNTLFSGATFSGDANFSGTKFWPGFPITDLNVTECVALEGVYFERQDWVLFNDVDMGKVSLGGTDVSRVRFTNVQWDEYRGGYSLYDQKILMLKHNEKYRHKYFKQALDRLGKLRDNEEELRENVGMVYRLSGDELNKRVEEIKEEIDRSLKISENDWGKQHIDKLYVVLTVEDVLSIYRFLRENYDYYLRYEDSGKFFIGEMETMRNFKGRFERVILTAYKWLCQYGESYTRPILWSLVAVIIFALIPIAEAVIPIVKAGIQLEASTLIPLLIENLKISVATFLQMYLELKTHIIIERILSITILGSLYVSLRRRLERKMRH